MSLDLHVNLTDEIVDNCTVLVGFKTYPHIDMYGAGHHAGELMIRVLDGEIDPVMSWGNGPLLAQTLRMGHEDAPMGPLIEAARRHERDGLLAATVFGGFPLADIGPAGMSVVTITYGDQARADAVRDELLEAEWEQREEFIFDSRPIGETLDEVAHLAGAPIIILDHADNSATR